MEEVKISDEDEDELNSNSNSNSSSKNELELDENRNNRSVFGKLLGYHNSNESDFDINDNL